MGKSAILTGKEGIKVYPVTASDLVYDKDTRKNMKETLAEKVEEAPQDGKQYARINGAWGEVEAGSVSETALITLLPNETALYGATVKVTTDDGQTLLDTTWQGSVLSVQVRAGLVYTVTVGEKDGYIAPEAVSYTAEKGVTRSISMTYTPSTLTLGILSNQGTSDSAISGVKATVKYGSTTVQMGNGDKINLPLNAAVTITFPAVTNYKAPSSISFTHTGGAVQKSGTYQTEVVNVTLSADNGTSVAGQIVTINGTQHTWNGTTISQKVAFGTSYSVSVDAKAGYTTPSSQSFTANKSSRNLTLQYIYGSMGVFIQGISGKLYTEAEWNGQETPNGIAVITSNCRFVIALANAYSSYCQWGGYGVEVSGITTTTVNSTAQGDYDGEAQTTTIINALKGTNDGYVDGAPAAEYCRAYTFPDGSTGYMGAAGEWQAALDNKSAIASALSARGGTAMSSIYWTSTQYSSDNSWYMRWSGEILDVSFKYNNNYNYVRAFAAI